MCLLLLFSTLAVSLPTGSRLLRAVAATTQGKSDSSLGAGAMDSGNRDHMKGSCWVPTCQPTAGDVTACSLHGQLYPQGILSTHTPHGWLPI